MEQSITLKVTSAFTVGGAIARPGELVDVSNAEAKDLLSRGKATLATTSEAPAKKAEKSEQGNEVAKQNNADVKQESETAAAKPKSGKKGK